MVIRNGNKLTWQWITTRVLLPIIAFGAALAIGAKIDQDKSQNETINLLKDGQSQLRQDQAFDKAVLKQLVDKVNEMSPKVDTILIYVKAKDLAQDLINER